MNMTMIQDIANTLTIISVLIIIILAIGRGILFTKPAMDAEIKVAEANEKRAAMAEQKLESTLALYEKFIYRLLVTILAGIGVSIPVFIVLFYMMTLNKRKLIEVNEKLSSESE
jgi:Sec-independent protein secretion pathway component TatC